MTGPASPRSASWSVAPPGKTLEGQRHEFAIDPRRRDGLLEGLDEVAQTLQRDAEIRAFQSADRAERPWIHFAKKTAGYVA